ncbi:MAG TPA: hypothetical protein VF796_30340 [Humisphaera sp.]
MTNPRPNARVLCLLACGALAAAATGCARGGRPPEPVAQTAALTRPAGDTELLGPTWVPAAAASCRPPVGWNGSDADKQPGSEHKIWISPSGATAYGAIVVRHWLMPLASDERVLGEFLKNMKASDGRADLLDKQHDPKLGGVGGIRFKVAGGKYTLRANLMSGGQRAWIVYAGTINAMPVDERELRAAEAARDLTVIEPAGAGPGK